MELLLAERFGPEVCLVQMGNTSVRANRKRIAGSVINKLQQNKNKFTGLLVCIYLTATILQVLASGTEIDTLCKECSVLYSV